MIKQLALSAVIWGALASNTYSQDTYDEVVLNNVRSILPNLIDAANTKLDADDSDLIPQIRIRIDPRNITNAFAYYENGRRRITIHNGLVLTFDLLAMMIANYDLAPQCADQYIQHMYQTWEQNTRRAAQGLSPEPLSMPPLLFQNDPTCLNFANALMSMPPKKAEMYKNLVESSIVMLFLHELAHHELGHVDNPSASLEESRQREDDADKWAIQRFYRIKSDPMEAYPYYLHALFTGGARLEDETLSTHPLGGRRMLDMITSVANSTTDGKAKTQLEFLSTTLKNFFGL